MRVLGIMVLVLLAIAQRPSNRIGLIAQRMVGAERLELPTYAL